jgi:hypothetical protein
MKPTRDITYRDIPFGLRSSSQIPGFAPGAVRSLPRITPPSRVEAHSIQPAAKGAVVPPSISKANTVSAGPSSSSANPVREAALPASNMSGAFDAGSKRR